MTGSVDALGGQIVRRSGIEAALDYLPVPDSASVSEAQQWHDIWYGAPFSQALPCHVKFYARDFQLKQRSFAPLIEPTYR